VGAEWEGTYAHLHQTQTLGVPPLKHPPGGLYVYLPSVACSDGHPRGLQRHACVVVEIA